MISLKAFYFFLTRLSDNGLTMEQDELEKRVFYLFWMMQLLLILGGVLTAAAIVLKSAVLVAASVKLAINSMLLSIPLYDLGKKIEEVNPQSSSHNVLPSS